MAKFKRLLRYDLPMHFVLLLTNWLPDSVIFLRLRGLLARPFFGKCGRDLRLGRNLTFYNPSQIMLGDRIYIAYGCWFMASARIELASEIMFGPYCVVVSGEHTIETGSFRRGKHIAKPIRVGHGVFVGSHVTITQGSDIGHSTLIGANSVVRGVLPPGVLAAGQPANIKKLFGDN